MSEDLFTCPECDLPEPETLGCAADRTAVFLLECDYCGRRWDVRAPTDAFYRD